MDDIARYLGRVADLVARKARLKPSRLVRLLETLRVDGGAKKSSGGKGKGKGKAKGRGKGKAAAQAPAVVVFGRTVVPIATLEQQGASTAAGGAEKASPNAGKAVQLKVLLCASGPDPPPACFIVSDREATVTAMSLYSLGSASLTRLTDKVVVTVLDPVLRTITYTPRGGGGDAVSYQCISVMEPHLLLVNGQQLRPSTSAMRIQNSG